MNSFDIRDFRDQLIPVEGRKNRYICPVCGGNDLTFDTDNYGGYSCWNDSSEEHRAEIREALSPRKNQRLLKEIRPKNDRTWTYQDCNGQDLIRTRRIDDGKGDRKIWQEFLEDGKWVTQASQETKQHIKESVLPYRYSEVKQAILQGKTLFWVEGEPCVDILWSMGIPAITTLGGSGGYNRGNYKNLFPDAQLVICPDRDKAGMNYAEKVAADYPGAQWLYPFPQQSSTWLNLPKAGGLDIVDWIEQEQISTNQILSAIEPKRNLGNKNILPSVAQVMSIEHLQTAVNELFDQSLSQSDLSAKILSLAERSRRQSKDVWGLYKARLQDLSDDSVSNIDELLTLQKSTLKARDIFDLALVELIEKTAIAIPTVEAWLITTLLPALGSAIGGKQRLVINPGSDYLVSPIVWSAIVSKSGTKKSPTQNAILKPLKELETEAYKRYESELKIYQKESKHPRDGEEEISSPVRERFVTTSSTPEGLTKILSKSSNVLLHKDEVRGLFNFGEYKKNQSSDEQYWLELFNGGTVIVDRADETKSILAENPCVGITGTIQAPVLEKLQSALGFEDSNGLMSRFLFCTEHAPPGYIDLESEDDSTKQLQIILKEIYSMLRDLPKRDYLLSPEAKQYFQQWQRHLVDSASVENHAGLAAVYPKIETYTGRFALILHVVWARFNGGNPAPVVSGETMQKAIVLAQYYSNQAKIIYATNDPESKQDRALIALIELGRRKGTLTAREAKIGIRALREQTPAQIRELFAKLVDRGYGKIEGEGIRSRWVYSTTKKSEPTTSIATPKPEPIEPTIKYAATAKPATLIATPKQKWEPKEGEMVRYRGNNENLKTQYSGLLRVKSVTHEGVSCLTDDDRITTWIPAKELQPVTSETKA